MVIKAPRTKFSRYTSMFMFIITQQKHGQSLNVLASVNYMYIIHSKNAKQLTNLLGQNMYSNLRVGFMTIQ